MHERDKLEYFTYGTIIVKCSDSWFTKPLKERFNDEHDGDDEGDEVAVACMCVWWTVVVGSNVKPAYRCCCCLQLQSVES